MIIIMTSKHFFPHAHWLWQGFAVQANQEEDPPFLWWSWWGWRWRPWSMRWWWWWSNWFSWSCWWPWRSTMTFTFLTWSTKLNDKTSLMSILSAFNISSNTMLISFDVFSDILNAYLLWLVSLGDFYSMSSLFIGSLLTSCCFFNLLHISWNPSGIDCVFLFLFASVPPSQ